MSGEGLATGGAQAPASGAVAVAEAPPSAGMAPAPEERPAPASPAPARQEPRPGSGGQWRPWLRGSAIGLLLLAVVVLGFVGYLYGLSGVQEARSQAILYTQLQLELANQVAPLGPYGPNGLNGTRGPTPLGSPVAILNIPSIGIHDMVVVQGTSPQNMMARTRAPARQPDAGPAGRGRRSTVAVPPSAPRSATSANCAPVTPSRPSPGRARPPTPWRRAAFSDKIIEDPAPNRMLLLTASSAGIPSYYYQVDARPYLQRPAEPGGGAAWSTPRNCRWPMTAAPSR